MRLRVYLALLSAGAGTVLAGCDANQLYLGSRSVVGINASVNPELNSGSLIVGYDRTFAAVIPRSVDDTQTGKQEAMTAIACSSLGVKGVTIKHFKESIATGAAAEMFANALKQESEKKSVKDFFDCFKNKPETKPALVTAATEATK